MKSFSWIERIPDEHQLSVPPSAAEMRWWAVERKRLRWRVILRFSLPPFVVFVGSMVILSPAKLLTGYFVVPAVAALMGVVGLVHWAVSEDKLRDREIRYKRIREGLRSSELPS
jgi:hypothetical protein